MAHLVLDLVCPEIGARPLVTHVIDLARAKDGHLTVEVDREFLAKVGDMATWQQGDF